MLLTGFYANGEKKKLRLETRGGLIGRLNSETHFTFHDKPRT